MSRNGTGTYSRAVADYVYDTVIDETAVNAEMDDIATALTQSLAKDGQTTPTANLPMGGFHLTGLGTGDAANDSTRVVDHQIDKFNWLGTASGADTMTATATPTLTAYSAGQRFTFIVGSTNTGAATLNIDSVGAKAIEKLQSALIAGDLTAGDVAVVEYDGTQFQLVSPTPVATASSATTSAEGIVELATTAETQTGTDATRAVTPDGLHDMTTLAGAGWFLDEDNMSSDDATKVASQQSIKAYVDNEVAGVSSTSTTLMTDTNVSSTAVDFTSIPAGCYKIEILIEGVGTDSTHAIIVQIGDSGGVETTGYLGSAGASTFTDGFGLDGLGNSSAIRHGIMTLVLKDASNNTWVSAALTGRSDTGQVNYGAGSKSLTGTLDRVRFTTQSAGGTLDAGSINVRYYTT